MIIAFAWIFMNKWLISFVFYPFLQLTLEFVSEQLIMEKGDHKTNLWTSKPSATFGSVYPKPTMRHLLLRYEKTYIKMILSKTCISHVSYDVLCVYNFSLRLVLRCVFNRVYPFKMQVFKIVQVILSNIECTDFTATDAHFDS